MNKLIIHKFNTEYLTFINNIIPTLTNCSHEATLEL